MAAPTAHFEKDSKQSSMHDASGTKSEGQQSKDSYHDKEDTGKGSKAADGRNSVLKKGPTELDENEKNITKPSPSYKGSDTKKPAAVDRSHIRRRDSSQDRRRSVSKDRKKSTSQRRSGSRNKRRSVSRRRSVSGNRRRSTSRQKDLKGSGNQKVVDRRKPPSSLQDRGKSSHHEPHMASKCLDSGIRVVDYRKWQTSAVATKDQSLSRSKDLANKQRSASRERHRSRSRRRSTSRRRSDSRSKRRKSSRSCDRHYNKDFKTSNHYKSSDKPKVLDQRRRFTDKISPRKKVVHRRSRSIEMGENDLRKRIELLKQDINRQKIELAEQQLVGRNRSEERYQRLLESESAWQQLALEEENRTSGRLEHLDEQYNEDCNQGRGPPASHKQAKYDVLRSPLKPRWHSREQGKAPFSRSRSKSPLASYNTHTSTHHSRPGSRLYNRRSNTPKGVESRSRPASASPPQRFNRMSQPLVHHNWEDADSQSAYNHRSPSANRRQLKRASSQSSSSLPRRQRRSHSPSPVSSDGRRSSSRCGSLDLEWPSSPCQPSSGAGREGNLSPISWRLANLGLPERQKIRLCAMQRANQLYCDRNDVLRPSASDISSTLCSDVSIGVERQSLRALSGSLKMNRSAGFDWSQRSVKDFNMRDLLGKGELYEVFKAVDKKGQSVVVLRSVCADRASDGFRRPALRVIKMLSQLVHPNIVRLLEVIKDESESAICDGNSGKYYLSFEFCAYDLHSLLHIHNMKFKPEHIACVVRQLLEGLAFCHQRGIVHCDVRPCNVLVSAKGEVKLSYFVGAHSAGDAVGDTSLLNPSSLCYRAPELILGAELWSTSADMWSVGCILGELMHGRVMFTANDDLQLLLTISSLCGTPSLAVWPDVVRLPRYYMLNSRPSSVRCLLDQFSNDPLEAVSLMDSMLVFNPSLRVQASVALSKQWLNNSADFGSFANSLLALERSRTLNRGYRPIDDFEFLSAIGSGEYGYTYKALDNISNNIVSLRTAGDSSGISDEAKKLLNVHRQLINPNIVQILETVQDFSKSASFMYYLCFEYAAHDLGGLLQNSIKFSSAQIGCIFSQILKALTFCHVKNIVHCDIRPCNILITSKGEVKLSGFTSCRMNGDPAHLDQLPVDSLWYRAPELLLGSNKLTNAVDMWSCGCVLGEMLNHKPLFGASVSEVQQLLAISALCGTPTPVSWPDVTKLPRLYILKNRPVCARRLMSEFSNEPPGIVELLDGLLTMYPAKRLMAFTALSGQWLKNLNVEPIRATLPLPKSRDCRSVSKQPNTSSAVDSSISEGAAGHVSGERAPTVLNEADVGYTEVSSSNSATGSMKIDLSSAESVHQALNKLLMASRNAESSSSESTIEEKTKQFPAAPKTFMKVIDHEYQPSDAVRVQKINVEPLRRPETPPVDETDHGHQHSDRRIGESSIEFKPLQPTSIVSGEDQDYRMLSSASRSSMERIDNAPTRSSNAASNVGSEFWDEMASYCAKYEANMSSSRMPDLAESVEAALSRYRDELMKGSRSHSSVSDSHIMEVGSDRPRCVDDFRVQRNSQERYQARGDFVVDEPPEDQFRRGIAGFGEDHIPMTWSQPSNRVPRETPSTIVAGPSGFGEDMRHVNLKNMVVTVGNDRFRPIDESPAIEISFDERQPVWNQRYDLGPPPAGRSAPLAAPPTRRSAVLPAPPTGRLGALAAPPKVREEFRREMVYYGDDDILSPRTNLDVDGFDAYPSGGPRNVFDQRTVVARVPASNVEPESGVEWRRLQPTNRP